MGDWGKVVVKELADTVTTMVGKNVVVMTVGCCVTVGGIGLAEKTAFEGEGVLMVERIVGVGDSMDMEDVVVDMAVGVEVVAVDVVGAVAGLHSAVRINVLSLALNDS